jgi:hypothetical protein
VSLTFLWGNFKKIDSLAQIGGVGLALLFRSKSDVLNDG